MYNISTLMGPPSDLCHISSRDLFPVGLSTSPKCVVKSKLIINIDTEYNLKKSDLKVPIPNVIVKEGPSFCIEGS